MLTRNTTERHNVAKAKALRQQRKALWVFLRKRSLIDIGRSQGMPETDGTHWRRRWGEDSRLIRHDPMDWTTETPWTVGNDALDSGDWLADAGDSLKRRAFGRSPWADKRRAYSASAASRSLDPAAAHDPANEKPRHTQAPTVLWACSPQRHMTPQTKSPGTRRRQPCCGLAARNTAGKQACLVPQNGQETGACPQCPQCPLYQSVTGYVFAVIGQELGAAGSSASQSFITKSPGTRRRQPCCGLQARNTAGKQVCLVPQNGQETGACPQCPQCPQCPLYQSVTGYVFAVIGQELGAAGSSASQSFMWALPSSCFLTKERPPLELISSELCISLIIGTLVGEWNYNI
jgi:hypothetical protein